MSSRSFIAGISYLWGTAGDYDGDGRTDPSVYRPASSHWFILESSSSHTTFETYQWGAPDDVPIAARR